jgi:hypothetical protein
MNPFIRSKYNVGDVVFVVNPSGYSIASSRIKVIQFYRDSKPYYSLEASSDVVSEDSLFSTVDEAESVANKISGPSV